MPAPSQRRHFRRGTIYFLVAVGLIIPGMLFFANIRRENNLMHAPGLIQITRQIGVAMHAYALDHNGHYPDGQSSTEVFQKLLDGGYIFSPELFYLALPGKKPSLPGIKILKPENVSFDVTSGVDLNSPIGLPVVFETGYRITYALGGAAQPRNNFDFNAGYWLTTLIQNYGNDDPPRLGNIQNGIAVAYIAAPTEYNQSVFGRYRQLEKMGSSANEIPNFVPPDFKSDGKSYRQLTPDGELR